MPLLLAGLSLFAASVPEADIGNQTLRVRLYLPDAERGFYRGTRFDWSGVIGSLVYAGHEFFPPWFQRVDPDVHDFVYDGADIVASPCTAATGPVEEFSTDGKGLGFDAARAGGTFIKIGVGVLQRPDDQPYDPYRLYPIKDGGTWTVTRKADAVEFRQVVADSATGYAYEYRKTVALVGGEPRMALDHVLRNTGRRAIRTSVYNHNFLYLDRRAPHPGVSLSVPFEILAEPAPPPDLANVRDHRISFARTLTGEDRVYFAIRGFGADARDHRIDIEDRTAGVGLRIQGDRPLSRMALWAIRAPISIEPFIDMTIEPGQESTWRTQYDFFTTR